MNELFPVESVTMDSPRLAWIKRERVVLYHDTVEPEQWLAGFDFHEIEYSSPSDFFAQEESMNGDLRIGFGDTEDEALAILCQKHGVKLWNEESHA